MAILPTLIAAKQLGTAGNPVTHSERSLSIGTSALLFALISLLVVGAGLIAGYGDVRSATVVAGSLFGLLLLAIPTLALYCAVIGSLVVVGLTQLYAPELQFIRWSVPVLASTLAGLAIVSRLHSSRIAVEGSAVSPMVWWMTAFAMLGLLSSALSEPTVSEFAFGFKGYFQVWGIFYAIALIRWREESVEGLPKILIWVALFQLPFVLHQYLVLVPSRLGLGGRVVAEDVVAGTLGASATGGGANAVLSILLITSVAILTALYKRGLISWARMAIAAVALLLPIFFSANRAAVTYIFVGYVMLFSRDILRKPLKTLFVGLIAALLFFGVLWTHATLLSRSDPDQDLRGFVSDTITRNVSTEYGHGDYELNRWTALVFWATEHRDGPLKNVLFGHGLGASRDASDSALEVDTLAQWRYEGMGIGLTAASGVLWELGIVGFMCLMGVFWAAFGATRRLARSYYNLPRRGAVFQGLQVAIVVLFMSLFYKNSFMRHLPFQALLVTVLGYIAYWQARENRKLCEAH